MHPLPSELFAKGCYLVIPPLSKGRLGGVEPTIYLEALMFSATTSRGRHYLPSAPHYKGGEIKNDQPRFSSMLLSKQLFNRTNRIRG
jgi:hypothetical protein